MTKADKMFDQLGFQKISNISYLYIDETDNVISVDFHPLTESWDLESTGYGYFRKELSIAINQKIKELGWLDDKEIPMKPNINGRYCGNCGSVRFVPQNNYCSNCGQKIDWSELDD